MKVGGPRNCEFIPEPESAHQDRYDEAWIDSQRPLSHILPNRSRTKEGLRHQVAAQDKEEINSQITECHELCEHEQRLTMPIVVDQLKRVAEDHERS